jgi:hypothetical protein
MLKAVPKTWFSWDFTIFEGDRPVADIDISWWRERGRLVVRDESYAVYREGLLSGAFVLEAEGRVLARADKPSAFLRSFVVEHEGRSYTLRARSPFRRELVLLLGSEEVGSISPDGFFTRRATVSLPEALALPVRVFLVWLTLILWKRDSESSS